MHIISIDAAQPFVIANRDFIFSSLEIMKKSLFENRIEAHFPPVSLGAGSVDGEHGGLQGVIILLVRCGEAAGAVAAGIDFIGVLYGFGLKEMSPEYKTIKRPLDLLLHV